MFTQYGKFAEGGKEFVINTPDLPRNWYNYLYTDHYITFTSQVGIGQGFLQDRLGKRLTAVEARGMYAHDGAEGWNLAGLPVESEWEDYRCVHGLGYTVIRLKNRGILSEYGLFVPNEDNPLRGYEVSWVKLTNETSKIKTLKVISYTDNSLDGTYKYQGYNTDRLDYDGSANGLVFPVREEWNGENRDFAFFAVCGQKLSGYDCARNAFIGPYDSAQTPKALKRGGCSNSACVAEKIGYAVQTTLTLKPGETGFVSFAVGLSENAEAASEIVRRFDTAQKLENELKAVQRKYEEIIGGVIFKTPDENLNCLMNYWLKYQTNMGSRWARVRHNGYRDIASDTECLATFNPKLAWERIKRLLTYQYSNGYAPRTFIDGKIRDNNFADCTVWLTFTVYSIVCELGGKALLNETVPFNDGSEASVYEHLRRSVDFLYHFRGLHGLIQIWGGDWNDCMNLAGLKHKGVSVWLSIAWYRANRQFGELAEWLGKKEDAEMARVRGEEMQKIVEQYGWDEKGEYYIYAYTDEDRKLGSFDCEEGRIFLNPQMWAVLSGISTDGREIRAMDRAEEELTYELGTAVSTPAYTHRDDGIGTMTTKAPGVQENGGVYLHAMCWKLAVDALLKREKNVEKDLDSIVPFRNPVVNGRAEPYTLSNCYMGRETGYRYGTPGQSWRTASGQWFVKAMVNYVFGLLPTKDGLTVNPCFPASWNGAEITKSFRGGSYHIVYKRTGRSRVFADGKEIPTNLLPPAGKMTEVTVEF